MADDDGGSGHTDPLSKATRTTKRNLLAASFVAILYTAFEISADKIPIAGLTISFDPRVFGFALAATASYFLVTFCLYYYIDIRNFARLPHQESTVAWRRSQTYRFDQRVADCLSKLLEPVKLDGFYLQRKPELETAVSAWSNGYPSTLEYARRLKFKPLDPMEHLYFADPGSETRKFSLHYPGLASFHDIPQFLTLAKLATETWTPFFRLLPLRYAFLRMTLRPRLWTVSLAYILRNYGVDGLFPIALSVVAILALYRLIDLRFLTYLAPPT